MSNKVKKARKVIYESICRDNELKKLLVGNVLLLLSNEKLDIRAKALAIVEALYNEKMTIQPLKSLERILIHKGLL